MLRIRLKLIGKKSQPFYSLVLSNSKTKRNGRSLKNLGFYDPLKKIFKINFFFIKEKIQNGAKLTKSMKKYLSIYVIKKEFNIF